MQRPVSYLPPMPCQDHYLAPIGFRLQPNDELAELNHLLRLEHEERLQRCRLRSMIIQKETERMSQAIGGASRPATDREIIYDAIEKLSGRLSELGALMEQKLTPYCFEAPSPRIDRIRSVVGSDAVPCAGAEDPPIPTSTPAGRSLYSSISNANNVVDCLFKVIHSFNM